MKAHRAVVRVIALALWTLPALGAPPDTGVQANLQLRPSAVGAEGLLGNNCPPPRHGSGGPRDSDRGCSIDPNG